MHEQKLAERWRFDERPQRGFNGMLCLIHLKRELIGVVEEHLLETETKARALLTAIGQIR